MSGGAPDALHVLRTTRSVRRRLDFDRPVAPEVLEELGARVWTLGCDPDGENINDDCGALYPGRLQKRVVEVGADLGIALDGDADRCLLVDEKGQLVDGDEILAIAAGHMAGSGNLRNSAVVATVMSNLGLEVSLREKGIELVRTPVGDRYVVEEMRRRNANLGGEQSGHIILLDNNTTGDGLITALGVLAIVVEAEKPLSELSRTMTRFPQVLVNVPIRERRDVTADHSVAGVIREIEGGLGDRGRVLVRASGTEPLIRVMVEGEHEDEVRMHAEGIADAIRASEASA